MIHSVEIDAKTFAAAKKIMVCADLDSVRLTRCKVTIDVDSPISESNQVVLSIKTKADGEKTSATSIGLAFDFTLFGEIGEQSSKAVQISLRMNASYRVPSELDIQPSDIKAFAASNGMLNIWPYWREFVQSITSRAGLPPLTVPLFRIQYKTAKNPKPTK